MKFNIYIYKQYDTDIYSLVDAGYDVNRMFKEALIGYANSRPVSFFIDRLVPLSLTDKKNVRMTVSIPNSDVKTIYMLKHIKDKYRGRFCKAVLRNALVQQNICGYFSDPNLMQLQNNNLAFYNLGAFPNLKPVSAYIKDTKVKILNQTVAVEHKEAIDGFSGNAFANLSEEDIKPSKKSVKKDLKPETKAAPSTAPVTAMPAPETPPELQDFSTMINNPQFMAQMMQIMSTMQGNQTLTPAQAHDESKDETQSSAITETSEDPDDEEISLASDDALLDAFSNI